jgi:ubiquinone/menaquinone biosynthesis C-methylase UbiE
VSEKDARFVGSIPANYDQHLGPLLFEPYAADLVQRIPWADTVRILELACGTGIATRRLRERLPAGDGASITATDLNEPMLEHAKAKFPGDARIHWRQADATALSFPDTSFDVVVCQFGVMFFPDKAAAYREARRVLRPGGTFVFNVWAGFDRNPMLRLTHQTLARWFPDNPPTFYETPCGYHDADAISRALRVADFTEVRTTPVALTGVSPSARSAAIGLVEGNPVVTAIAERGMPDASPIVAAVAAALAAECGDHPMRAKMEALVISARAG